MNLEERKQVYLEKQKELENKKFLLTVRLERIRDNKEKEID